MTEEECKEADEAWVTYIFDMIGRDAPEPKVIWMAGYAAACEAKQRVIELCAQGQQLLTDRGLRMQRLYEAERARSAKLEAMLSKAMHYLKEGKARLAPHTTNSFVDDLIAEYEAARD